MEGRLYTHVAARRLLIRIAVLGCLQGEAVSVGAGGRLPNLLGYGMASAACTCC